jgi:CheY-like chemotaxis protein
MRNDSLNDEKSVMVVDDDPSVRESMSRLLEAKGYAVLQADNGQTALDLLKKEPHFPCLVILDLAMPIMDGPSVLGNSRSGPHPARYSGSGGIRKPASA